MFKMYFSELFMFVVIATYIHLSLQSECKMTENDLDNCIKSIMFFGNRNAIVPANDGEMDQHCKVMHDGIDCFKEYADTCLKDFPHDVTKVLTSSLKKHMETRCDNPKDRKEFIDFVQCFLPKEEKMPSLHECSDKHTKMIQLAVDMGAQGHIHGSCCAFHMFTDCILTRVEGICSKGHKQFWEEVFQDVAQEAVTFACGQLVTKEKCSELHTPEHYLQLKAVDESNDPSFWSTGFVTPVKYLLEMVRKYHHAV